MLKCDGLFVGVGAVDELLEDFVRGHEVEDFSGPVVQAFWSDPHL